MPSRVPCESVFDSSMLECLDAHSNCAACHVGGRNVILAEKTLQQEALEQYLDGGANEIAVRKQVTNGKNAMPAFGGRLSDDDVRCPIPHAASARVLPPCAPLCLGARLTLVWRRRRAPCRG